MKNVHSVTVFAAIAAGAALAAMPIAAESAAVRAADAAAQSNYRNAVAGCNRMKGSEARRCMRDADAARNAAEFEARDMQGDARFMDLIFLPAAEGGAGDASREQRTPGGITPTYRILPDVKGVPDNLARNAAR
jgi:hypothetical protein